jgi:HKD family nuclease
MRNNIFKVIEDARDVTNAIVLTHNIDFIFIQSVVLPALRKCGSPALTIFADAHCAEQAYQQQALVLNSLGLRYRVVPVAMKTGFRFHPKAILLSSKKQATLLVGSGNTTFGGWRENGEIWFRYDTEVDGTGPHAAFREYLREVLELTAHSRESVTREIEEAFDTENRGWAASMEPATGILGRAGQGKSLLDRMGEVIGDRKADHVYVCTPYFDADAEALTTLAARFRVDHSTVLVKSGRTNLIQSAADKLGPGFRLKRATFEHQENTGPEQNQVTRETLLHAKFYAFRCGLDVVVFAGSANCSRAALTIPGSDGNAELMSTKTLTSDEFERDFLSELVIKEVPPQLAVDIQEPPSLEEEDFIHIHTARMIPGTISVAFYCSSGITLQSASVDKTPLKPEEMGLGWARFRTTQSQPLTILLVGRKDEKEFLSPLHWIDNEAALGVSARFRSLGDSIRKIGQSREWGIGAWSEVLTELYKHLEYMPKGVTKPKASFHGNGSDSPCSATFTWRDVFSEDYGLPVHSFISNLPFGMEPQIGGLKSLLLRWFGIEEPGALGETEDGTAEPVSPPSAGLSEEEPTDLIEEPPPPKPPQRPPAPASATERKRALKLVGQVAARLASEAYVLERPPAMLSADLKITSVVLRIALGNGWITQEEFFKTTLEIWLPLFFNAAGGYEVGLLEFRHLNDSGAGGFVDTMRSAELSAALAAWALAVPAAEANAMHARFSLASALSVARLPWLWQTGEVQEIARQVAGVLAHASGSLRPNGRQIESQWLTLIRRGYALSQLEPIVAEMKIGELSTRIKRSRVYAGELLWQKPVGFCVAGADCHRTADDKCVVLQLQRGDAKKTFKGDFLIPLAELVDDKVINDQRLSANARREISEMARELRTGLQNLSQEASNS